MDALAERLDEKLRQWKPETAAEVRERVAEVIELADHDVIDLIRSRSSEQEVAAKPRPVIVVSRRDPNPPRALVLYVPLTT